MKHKTSIHCLLLSALIAPAGMAQAPDSLLTRRHCNHRNESTQWVPFGELGDTASFITALREAADTDEAVTSVRVDYKEDGRIAGVHAAGARSHRAAKDLETEFRTRLSPLGALPKHFSITVARLNATDYIDLLPGLVTCPPEYFSTSKSDSVLQEMERLFYTGKLNPQRQRGVETTLIGFWLDASGDARAIWIQHSSGDYLLDKLALDMVQNARFLPPLVGSRAAPAVDHMPVQFRSKAPPRFP